MIQCWRRKISLTWRIWIYNGSEMLAEKERFDCSSLFVVREFVSEFDQSRTDTWDTYSPLSEHPNCLTQDIEERFLLIQHQWSPKEIIMEIQSINRSITMISLRNTWKFDNRSRCSSAFSSDSMEVTTKTKTNLVWLILSQ